MHMIASLIDLPPVCHMEIIRKHVHPRQMRPHLGIHSFRQLYRHSIRNREQNASSKDKQKYNKDAGNTGHDERLSRSTGNKESVRKNN